MLARLFIILLQTSLIITQVQHAFVTARFKKARSVPKCPPAQEVQVFRPLKIEGKQFGRFVPCRSHNDFRIFTPLKSPPTSSSIIFNARCMCSMYSWP
jgi:hypothetical protein